MESLLKCPACRSRLRPGDEWCTLCYVRIVVPAPQPAPAEAQVQAPAQVDVAAGIGAPDLGPGPGPASVAGTRRVRRAEVDQLADAMLSELAASQSTLALPGPMDRVLTGIGLGSSDGGARKAVGITIACAAMASVLTAGSWLAGLLL